MDVGSVYSIVVTWLNWWPITDDNVFLLLVLWGHLCCCYEHLEIQHYKHYYQLDTILCFTLIRAHLSKSSRGLIYNALPVSGLLGVEWRPPIKMWPVLVKILGHRVCVFVGGGGLVLRIVCHWGRVWLDGMFWVDGCGWWLVYDRVKFPLLPYAKISQLTACRGIVHENCACCAGGGHL